MAEGNSARYAAGQAPADVPQSVRTFLDQELPKIAAAINLVAQGHVDVTYVAPAKPRIGDFRLAAGAPYWNPIGAAGFTWFDGTTWKPYVGSSTMTPRAPLYTAAPPGATDGDIVRADGTSWNPGSGAGFYGMHNGVWRYLG